jgi:drug/metabolite transporter (DMT)-like permease
MLQMADAIGKSRPVHLPMSRAPHVTSRRVVVYAGLLYVAFVWALNTVAVKYAFTAWRPMAFTGIRFMLMVPLSFALARVLGERIHVEKRDLPLLLGCGACGYGIYQYLWVIGLAHTTAFASALLATLAPVITLAIVAFSGDERVRSGRWLGAAIALFGVAVFEGAFAGHATFRIGDGLTLASAAIFALFNVFSARLLDRYTPFSLVVISLALGTVMILPGAIPEMVRQDWSKVTLMHWGVLAFAVVFPIVLSYPVWSYGISQLGAGRTSLFQFAVPVIAGFLSVAMLGSHISRHEIVGAAVCIAGMAISQVFGKVSLTAIWAQRVHGMER